MQVELTFNAPQLVPLVLADTPAYKTNALLRLNIRIVSRPEQAH